jgi:hypothetical protein
MKPEFPPVISLLFFFFFSPAFSVSQQTFFEQRADHEIHVRLDDVNHFLHASIKTRYTNNSSDTLHEIYIHLWPNAYASRNTAFAQQMLQNGNTDFHFAPDEERGFIDSLDFRINGSRVSWGLDEKNPDIGLLYLDDPLLPGQTLAISTPFRVKFPHSRFSRLGHSGQAYYATQWYPKPAVYDQDGWHPMPYLNMGEFYSSFGDVDVFLTLPENYVVASTGIVMSQQENEWLDKLSVATYLNGGPENLPDRTAFPPSSEQQKTIHLRQENVHDFAWFADKRFYVLRGQMNLPESERRVLVGAYFHSRSDQWLRAINYASEALGFMSQEVLEYPWEVMSVVQGINSAGAGMEYPAVTIIGEAVSDMELERVIVHETIHNWFYGLVATNERAHPWLDEGLTTFFENRYMTRKYPDHKLAGSFAGTALAAYFDVATINHHNYYELWYLFKARRNLDQPVNLPSDAFSMLNYFGMVYYKAALAMIYLEAYLGREVFDLAMKTYTNDWAYRHPGPGQLREAFERASGKELSWFFDEVIGTNGKIDYAIASLKTSGYNLFLVDVDNKGDISSPFSISGIKNGKVIHSQWYEGFEGSRAIVFPKGKYDLIQIDHDRVIPEINRRNNNYWFNKSLPRLNPVELQLLASVENPQKTKIYYMPILGWNKYNGVTAGTAFYNYVFPSRPVELFFMPLYGTANDKLAGTAWAYRSFFPERGRIQNYRIGLQAQRYAFSPGLKGWSFNRLEASVEAALKKPHAASSLDRTFFLKSTLVNRNIPVILDGQVQASEINYLINEIGFLYAENRVINPYSAGLSIEQGEQFIKASGQATYFLHYPALHRGIDIRFFAGTFLRRPVGNSQIDYRFRLSGQRGVHDYAFETTFLGRTEPVGTFWGNQMVEADGGFKFPTSVGQTWDWLFAVNLKADFPVLPIKAYLDAGTYAGADTAFEGSQKFSWVLGIQVTPIKGLLEVNFPLAVSSDIEQVAGFAFDNYLQKVTFSLYLDKANPFRFLRDLRFSSLRQI